MKTFYNPPRGFRDFYPEEEQIKDYLFEKIKNVAKLFGFLSYDGPILENINIYLNKTSEELINRQTFAIKTKEETLLMRPEMTPTLARMIANKINQLNLPIKLFNLGLRFRYEAPQKGRLREFYQADFDIIGSNTLLSDLEIISVVVFLFKKFGFDKEDFIIYLNSRLEMERILNQIGFNKNQYSLIFKIIDKKDKISFDKLIKMFLSIEKDKEKINQLIKFLESKKINSSYFKNLFNLLEKTEISQYCQINYNIVRGLDYYTGLVFEVWDKKNQIKRALAGGGRYDNLIDKFNPKIKISGIGFATSDVVLLEFLKNRKFLPSTKIASAKVLITVFNNDLIKESVKLVNFLRNQEIASEIFLNEKKLDKQLKYADKNNIPYVIILGPEEIEKGIFKLKEMKTGKQNYLKLQQLIKFLKEN